VPIAQFGSTAATTSSVATSSSVAVSLLPQPASTKLAAPMATIEAANLERIN
jgi:hypothetical protein